ncbi:MAG: helix-turn-helix protein [Actinobacteria bacterium]|jgi:predicted transcriptional regulator/transcriptional regulator with XRE-family HTH domain|nr:helix-turn-helix protein [Actinomycetota bacterium]MEA2501974.1 family transcriptional regulator, fatty acid utilization regulator [Actinomycetota bacterium]MEA2565173.1 family transcriptional regulator, fatty acid utilization regulator [Actinomycetota bacterium]MEA2591473.1 family transcriptional regulator, fatty acid utilization regulator [Actinomycetota bacterium]
MQNGSVDSLVFGQRLRHLRRSKDLTLDQLGELVGKQASFLSLIENGKREARLSLIEDLARGLGVSSAELLATEPPTRRARLEVELQRAQEDPLYKELNLPLLRPSRQVPHEFLEHVVGLFEALKARSQDLGGTPEGARAANARLRAEMRARDNYFPEIELVATQALRSAGYEGGAVAESTLTSLVAHYGFTLHRVQDLPVSVDSVADLEHRRIYVHQRNTMPTRAARSVVLQTLGHFALGHGDPKDFGEFLRQRVEANYFSGAVLAPQRPAVELLTAARRKGDISAEDLKEVFYISYQMAAHRLTNLATHHLGLAVHFLRTDDEGVIWKAYENDGAPFPTDSAGIIEGQRVCRKWGTRQAFGSYDKFAEYAQYTSTPAGEFWCSTYLEADMATPEAVTIGARAEDARYFRGHETTNRKVSRCPDGECCRRPPSDAAARWQGRVWPAARVHSYVLATLPAGAYAGADLSEVYDFLDRQLP